MAAAATRSGNPRGSVGLSRLILVRHGETVWHAENRYAGRSDVALSPRGIAQAGQLARWAASAKLAAVWCSPLARARDTATPAAAAAGLSLKIDSHLSEIDFGRGEGLTSAEMKASFPVERAAFTRDPATHFLPDGEPPERAAERGVAALQRIASENDANSRILIVAHNTILRLVLCRLLGIELSQYRVAFPQVANAALIELELTSQGAGLLSFNLPLPD